MTPNVQDFERLRFTLDAFTDLSMHAIESREFSSAARSILYLVLGAVGVPRGVLLACDAEGRLYPVAVKPARNGFELANWGEPVRSPALDTASLAQAPQMIPAGDKRIPARLRALLGEQGLDFALPLVVRRRLAGLLALGRRVNGAALGPQERAALETLGRYAGVLLHEHELTRQLRSTIDENVRLCENLADTYFETVRAFSAAIDAKDVYTRGHSLRVARYSTALAARAGLPRKSIAGIRMGAYLHDIGKLVLDRSLLNKPARLSDDERREMISHPTVGFEVLSSVSFPWPEVRDIVRYHHERVDGTGYPDRLTGVEIPLPARVMSVADAFDAMTSKRPYRKPLPLTGALNELVECSGTQFDAGVVRVFLEQCRTEVADRPADGERRGTRTRRPRILAALLPGDRHGVTAALIDRLLKTLGPSPLPQFA